MSFDFSTLVTDRSQADLDTLRALLAVPLEDWTAEQLAEFNQATSKGAYNYTDLNRVTACMDYLYQEFSELGYSMPMYLQDASIENEGCIPTDQEMKQYITNLLSLRSALKMLQKTPESPKNMSKLNYLMANDIEKILYDINQLIIALSNVFIRSGMIWAVSGGENFQFIN